jgi:hypothetical protein
MPSKGEAMMASVQTKVDTLLARARLHEGGAAIFHLKPEIHRVDPESGSTLSLL